MDRAKTFFEELYRYYNKLEYIHTDPIRFPHEIEGNKEFIAFTSACFAYGNMNAIQGFLFKFFDYAGTDPLTLNDDISDKIYYRFQKSSDISAYSTLMKKIYTEFGSLQAFFKDSGVTSIGDCHKAISRMQSMSIDTHGMKFLIPVPKSSASKRLYMFLRWMVRKDDVDLGLWSIIDKSTLYMPADTHILRMAIHLGLINKNSKGKKAVDEVTSFFQSLNRGDPAKYDFSLTRLGIVNKCQYKNNPICNNCLHKSSCLFVDIGCE